MVKELVVHSRAGSLPLDGTHVSRHICWPWDLDLWLELNNGRTLTLFDLGRMPLARRTGLEAALRAHGWGLTVAGVSVRYRRRIRAVRPGRDAQPRGRARRQVHLYRAEHVEARRLHHPRAAAQSP